MKHADPDRLRTAILNELFDCLSKTDGEQVEQLAAAIKDAPRVFIQGKGRMGMILKAFAYRLASICRVHNIGDVTVPPIGLNDLLIVTPTGGDPRSSTRFLEIARENKAHVAALTANRAGPIGRLADLFLEVDAKTMLPEDKRDSVQPMCSTLEQLGLLLFDSIVLLLERPQFTFEEADRCVRNDLARAFKCVPETDIVNFLRKIDDASRLFFDASGRELQLLSCFAMRCYHMGKQVYVANEVSTPCIAKGDTLVVSCSDDADESLLLRAKRAKERGAALLALTGGQGANALRSICDAEICISADRPVCGLQSDGAVYGQCMLLTLDYAVAKAMRQIHMDENVLINRHTNLE